MGFESGLKVGPFPHNVFASRPKTATTTQIVLFLCQHGSVLISQPWHSHSLYSSLPHKTKALGANATSSHVREHLIPCAWATNTFSFPFSLGRGMGPKGGIHLGGESGVLVAHWANAKGPICLAIRVPVNSRGKKKHGKELISLKLKCSNLLSLRRGWTRECSQVEWLEYTLEKFRQKGKWRWSLFLIPYQKKKFCRT